MQTPTFSSRPVFGRSKLLFVLAGFLVLTASCDDKPPLTSSSLPPPYPSSSSSPSSSSTSSLSSQSSSQSSSSSPAEARTKNIPEERRSPTKVISLAESITRSKKYYQDPERAKASKAQWERALAEIKNLALPPIAASPSSPASNGKTAPLGSGNLFQQWRLLLDEPTLVELDPETNMTTAGTGSGSESESGDESPEETTSSTAAPSWPSTSWPSRRGGPPRFEGFASWERTLQDWADDVQEYMDKIEAENSGYPMSTFGNPQMAPAYGKKSAAADANTTTAGRNKEIQAAAAAVTATKKMKERKGMQNSGLSTRRKKPISLPVPAAVKDGEDVLPHTDLSDKSKNIWIVTTAALPWMTGTAVNPALRAAYMTEGRAEAGGSVTLMLPWLERIIDQETVYGANRVFESPKTQEEYIRTWLRDTASLSEASECLRIQWYTAWHSKIENSVYSMGDITALIPAEEADICILEEPEHLNWYRAPGDSWTDKFKHVVGIIHTNYFVYAQDQPAAFIRAPGMRLLCAWMCRAHCHRIIKLSGTLGQFAPEKELTENVHGIRGSFLKAGREVSKRIRSSPGDDPVFGSNAEASVYFIGKMLWSKGLGSLMELLKYAEESAGIKIHVDMYGGGPDKDAADAKSKALDVDMEFHGPIDHAALAFTHKIFINPSTSEVLCTTVAEALGMGKFVIVPSHPSNDFFAQFPNCLTYTNKEEFVGNLYYALTHFPEPLSVDYSHALSWEAATERMAAAGSIPAKEAELMAQALSSNGAGIEISLPSLIEDGEGREIVASRLRRSRERYRQFRSRLAQEVLQSRVLPNGMKQLLVNELEKRLELDIDRILDSPKLRLQLSPAELDKQLLELYKKVADGPSGDMLRIIGGGKEVALQDFYIKKQAARGRAKKSPTADKLTFGPFEALGDDAEGGRRTASQLVNSVLRRNLPKTEIIPRDEDYASDEKDKSKMSLSLSPGSHHCHRSQPWTRNFPRHVAFLGHSCRGRSPSASFSLLI